MKKIFPILLAVLTGIAALFFMRPPEQVAIVTATRDLPAGYTLTANDLQLTDYPESLAPSGAFTDPALATGQTLSVPRAAGDPLYPSNLGGEKLVLAANERAIALEVSNAAGLGGVLKAGDSVGVTAILQAGQGSERGIFSKVVATRLRVLFVDPQFAALEPQPSAAAEDTTFGAGAATTQRRKATLQSSPPPPRTRSRLPPIANA